MTDQLILEVDTRKRISLGSLASAGGRYLVEVDEDSVITLRPAVVLAEDELRLLQRPDILQAVADSRARSAAGEPGAQRPVRRRAGDTA